MTQEGDWDECMDCSCRTEGDTSDGRHFNVGYMLEQVAWDRIHDDYFGFLCLICAQIRMGRKFVPTDFRPAPLNSRNGGALDLLFPYEGGLSSDEVDWLRKLKEWDHGDWDEVYN